MITDVSTCSFAEECKTNKIYGIDYWFEVLW